jgi:hypothetical protein
MEYHVFNDGKQRFCKVLHIAIAMFFLNALWCGNFHTMLIIGDTFVKC